jgi:FtsP/CotA-like multicopper oxidase with cupredoxin domain
MRFKVVLALDGAKPNGPLPAQLREPAFSVPGPVAKTRFVTLEEVLAGPVPRAVLLNGMHFADPVTETPALNSTEDWWLVNLSADTHPIHLHLVQFEIMEQGEPYASYAHPGALRPSRQVRVALPHTRARGQRYDAALRRRVG